MLEMQETLSYRSNGYDVVATPAAKRSTAGVPHSDVQDHTFGSKDVEENHANYREVSRDLISTVSACSTSV